MKFLKMIHALNSTTGFLLLLLLLLLLFKPVLYALDRIGNYCKLSKSDFHYKK